MTLADLASVAAIVGNLALILTLIYVALQVRQAEKNQRASIQQGRANRLTDIAIRLAEPALTDIWSKGARAPEALTADELDRFLGICRAAFVSGEDSFLQHRSGLLDEAAFASFITGAKGQVGNSAGMRAAWRLSSHQFDAGFAQFMDDLIQETPLRSYGARLADWVDVVQADHSPKTSAQSV